MNKVVDNCLILLSIKIKQLKLICYDQIETCKQFMKQGIGMAVLPESVSESMKSEYPHVPLTLNGKSVTRDTWVCFQKGIRKLPQVDEFISALTERTFLDRGESL